MIKKPALGRSLDDFRKEEGVYENFKAQAEQEMIVWQLQEAMKAQNISKSRMAERMQSSRAQVDKLRDPAGNVALETLHKAAAVVGRRVEVRLVTGACYRLRRHGTRASLTRSPSMIERKSQMDCRSS